jgi:hypothetical protein
MGFTTVPEGLRAAGNTGQVAVGELHGADCGKPVADVAAALPGSKSASAATTFSESWSTTFTEWCTHADQHAAALTTAAGTYVAGEHVAQESIPGGDAPSGPR